MPRQPRQHLTQRKDGLFQEVMTINGKRKYFYGHSKAEVLRKIKDFKEAQENGLPFQTVVDLWWKEHEQTLAYNTIKSYKPALERAAEEFFDVGIKSITPADISTHIKRFSKSHADKTVRTQLMVYNLIFKYAVSEGYVEQNARSGCSFPPRKA